jgi:phosphoglycerate dehydrogenase-like enzyme
VEKSSVVKNIAVLDDYQNVALRMADWSPVSERANIVVFSENLRPEEITKQLRDFEIVCLMRERTKFPRGILAALPKLELLASTAPRNAAIDMAAASELGVAVAWTEGRSQGTPELAWGLILSAIRRIPQEAASLRSGMWQRSIGKDIDGRTLGILGLGNIGQRVAKVANAFGMQVIAWSLNLDPQVADGHGVRAVSRSDLFRQSDILTIHMVLSERSIGIVGRTELGLMKSTAWLVNTSRGQLVDEAALIESLRDQRIAGAALDVYDVEPLPSDHPFRSLPNVVATPHIGYVTEDTYRLFFGQTVENVLAWLNGHPVRTVLPSGQRRSG